MCTNDAKKGDARTESGCPFNTKKKKKEMEKKEIGKIH